MKGVWEATKGFCGAVATLFVGQHYMIQLFAYAVALDVLTGLIAGWAERQLSSDVSRKGMARKAIMFLAVGGAEVASRLTCTSITMPWGAEWSFGAALAGYYAIQEALSITENISRAGVPLPQALMKRLEQLKNIDKEV